MKVIILLLFSIFSVYFYHLTNGQFNCHLFLTFQTSYITFSNNFKHHLNHQYKIQRNK
jgi:hypothetical protein